jgi:hypothetical protein
MIITKTLHDDEICALPTERVPIMLEITEEDRQTAGPFGDIENCLVCTALKRMGHTDVSVGCPFAFIGGKMYRADGIESSQLGSTHSRRAPFYKPEVVGKQIIFYPTDPV